MHWLQIGASKSGNLWLYRILQSVIRHADIPQKNFIKGQPIHAIAKDWPLGFKGQADIDTLSINPHQCLYRISGVYNMPIDDIDSYIQATSHVWTQSLVSEMTRRVLPKFDKRIYILRDPRDRVISMARFALVPYRRKFFGAAYEDESACLDAVFYEGLQHWVQHVGGHLELQNAFDIHFVLYERLLFDFDAEMTRLVQYLGVPPTAEFLAKVKKDVEFETMKNENPQHVRKGSYGEWTERLSPSQIRSAERLAGPLLKLLRYPANTRQFKSASREAVLPRLPDRIRPEDARNALKHAGRWELVDKLKRNLPLLISGR